ncbi:MAG TPA: PAS domain S-box protein [Oxalicibacterium sp.]|nr:PAS domain S-box protein [Oxalicibacterium sp.]
MKPSQQTAAPALTEIERFRFFIEGVTDYAIYMLTSEGYVASWNAGAERFKGYKANEIIGLHFSRFYTEEDRLKGLPAETLNIALQQGKFEAEGRRVRKDGTIFWASVVVDPIRDERGELIGFAKITRDITEKKTAQAALYASEQQFRLLVQSVTDYAIYMLSVNGEVTNWNTGAQRIKGYRADEVVGTHFSRFYTEEDRRNGLPMKALSIARDAGRYENEGWRMRKDRKKFWAHVVIDPIYDDLGELIGFAKITHDFTEKREAAIALERTREALFQSQKLEAIGKLTGGVAHDFNNLLNVMVSGMELLSREIHSPAGRKVLDSMQRSASRGATLTQQLLSFARKQPLQKNKHNLNQMLTTFEPVLHRICDDSIRFDMVLAPALRPVMIDATQFETALLNLVSNARDAMPDGGSIVFRTENVQLTENAVGNLPAGDYAKLTVQDNGTGMLPGVAAQAIEPFFTTKEQGKGTGMGLSQVYGLMQQCDGDLVVDTAIGKGTAIHLYLPEIDAGDESKLASTELNNGNDKALVVDDQPDVLEVAVELFRNMGYDVLPANNGLEALEILKRTPDIDVLFSDVVMPGMNGHLLGQEARKLRPEIKVVLASGYPMPALQDSDLGNFSFIQKPYRMSEIMKTLRRRDTD